MIIAGFHTGAVDQCRTLDRPDDRAGDVEVFLRVDARHFGGLTAQECNTVSGAGFRHAADHLCGNVRLEFANGVVVQEEQRLRVHAEDVVDAVIDEILTDGAEPAQGRRDEDFRADAIGAGYQNGVAIAAELEAAAEAADSFENPGVAAARGDLAIARDRCIAGVDIDPGRGIRIGHIRSVRRNRRGAISVG